MGWVLKKIRLLIKNCKFYKKFGKALFHKANSKLYGGNINEVANREFINKTVEEVFTLTKEQKQKKTLLKGDLQIDNEKWINKIKKEYKSLSKQKEKDEKYALRYKAIEEFFNFMKRKIEDVMDEYYDSETFKIFQSMPEIIEYDKKFYYERNRNFSLLEKNNFVRLVNLPYYIKKNNLKK